MKKNNFNRTLKKRKILYSGGWPFSKKVTHIKPSQIKISIYEKYYLEQIKKIFNEKIPYIETYKNETDVDFTESDNKYVFGKTTNGFVIQKEEDYTHTDSNHRKQRGIYIACDSSLPSKINDDFKSNNYDTVKKIINFFNNPGSIQILETFKKKQEANKKIEIKSTSIIAEENFDIKQFGQLSNDVNKLDNSYIKDDNIEIIRNRYMKKIENRAKENAIHCYPIIDKSLQELIITFINFKLIHGTILEQKFYNKNYNSDSSPYKKVSRFINRILFKRPKTFQLKIDEYKFRTNKGNSHDGTDDNAYFKIGKEEQEQREGLTLEETMSYDEMEISALVSMSWKTPVVNDGDRLNGITEYTNKSEINLLESLKTNPIIYVGCIGARFERPQKMEYRFMMLDREQNTVGNGYGEGQATEKRVYLKMWYKFYTGKDGNFPTFDEMIEDKEIKSKYTQIHNQPNKYLNNFIYKIRMKKTILPFLLHADHRGKTEDGGKKNVYCHVVGLGIGAWAQDPYKQAELIYDVYIDILKEYKFDKIKFLDFSWFPQPYPNDKFLQINNDITIIFSKNTPSGKGSNEDIRENSLIVAQFAWDSNAYPGNEFWLGQKYFADSGDPAAACCSGIAAIYEVLENENPENQYLFSYGGAGKIEILNTIFKNKFERLKIEFVMKGGIEDEKRQATEIYKKVMKDKDKYKYIGLTYSANGEQSYNIRRMQGENFEKISGFNIISGSNQAAVITQLQKLVRDNGVGELFDRKFRIIPFSTMSYNDAEDTVKELKLPVNGNTDKNLLKIKESEIQNCINYLNTFFKIEKVILLAWVNQDTPAGKYAIGGGISKTKPYGKTLKSFVDDDALKYFKAINILAGKVEKVEKAEIKDGSTVRIISGNGRGNTGFFFNYGLLVFCDKGIFEISSEDDIKLVNNNELLLIKDEEEVKKAYIGSIVKVKDGDKEIQGILSYNNDSKEYLLITNNGDIIIDLSKVQPIQVENFEEEYENLRGIFVQTPINNDFFDLKIKEETIAWPPSDIEKQLIRNLEMYGFKLCNVPGDNNCQFHAIIDQLRHKKINNTDIIPDIMNEDAHQLLRSAAVKWLKENGNKQFIGGNEHSKLSHFYSSNEGDSWDKICDLYNKVGKTWGSELTLIAISDLFNVNIVVISNVRESEFKRETWTPFKEEKDAKNVLVIGHYYEFHYVSTRKINYTVQSQAQPQAQPQAQAQSSKSESKPAAKPSPIAAPKPSEKPSPPAVKPSPPAPAADKEVAKAATEAKAAAEAKAEAEKAAAEKAKAEVAKAEPPAAEPPAAEPPAGTEAAAAEKKAETRAEEEAAAAAEEEEAAATAEAAALALAKGEVPAEATELPQPPPVAQSDSNNSNNFVSDILNTDITDIDITNSSNIGLYMVLMGLGTGITFLIL